MTIITQQKLIEPNAKIWLTSFMVNPLKGKKTDILSSFEEFFTTLDTHLMSKTHYVMNKMAIVVHDRKAFFCFGRNRNRPKQPCFFSAETDTETENVFMFRPKPIPKPNLQYPSYQFNRGVCGTSWQLKNAQKHFQKTPCIILLDFCNKCYFLIEDTNLKY